MTRKQFAWTVYGFLIAAGFGALALPPRPHWSNLPAIIAIAFNSFWLGRQSREQ